MRRARIESLEERKMFSVTDLIIDPFDAAVFAQSGESTAIVDFIDPDEFSTPSGLRDRTETVTKDETITIGAARRDGVLLGDSNANYIGTANGGVWRNKITHTYDGDLVVSPYFDFNNDGRLDVAAERNQEIEVENDETHFVGHQKGSSDDPIPLDTFSLNFAVIREVIARTGMPGQEPLGWSWGVSNAARRNITGDFNGDGRDDLATLVGGQEGQELTQRPQLLPYMEQDNVYKLVEAHDAQAESFVSALYTDLLGRTGIASAADGASNTLMFGQSTGFVSPVDLDLLGLHVDTSPIDLSVMGLDTWEHAYLSSPSEITIAGTFEHATAPSGVLIGLLIPEAVGTPTGPVTFALVVDPANPNVVYIGGSTTHTPSQLASFCFADGSVRFIRVDTTGMADPQSALVASNEHRSNVTASLLASNEYFSRFTNTTLDDEAAAAVTVNWGDGASQVTHDKEFENWANASRFDRGYLPPAVADVLVSRILHEDNEFSFPRMSKAGAAIMAEWTSTRG
jgi:hypothetical protein